MKYSCFFFLISLNICFNIKYGVQQRVLLYDVLHNLFVFNIKIEFSFIFNGMIAVITVQL